MNKLLLICLIHLLGVKFCLLLLYREKRGVMNLQCQPVLGKGPGSQKDLRQPISYHKVMLITEMSEECQSM